MTERELDEKIMGKIRLYHNNISVTEEETLEQIKQVIREHDLAEIEKKKVEAWVTDEEYVALADIRNIMETKK